VSAGIAAATIRVTVVGDAGRADLAVPLWVDVASLAHSFAETVGTEAPRLASTSGILLDATSTVEQAGLRHGDVLVALAPAAAPHPVDETSPTAAGPRPSGARVQSLLLALAATCGLGGTAALAAGGGSGAARAVCLVLLLLCATVSAAPLPGASGASARARTAASPAFAAGAGFAATYTDGPGGLLLGLVVAALAAAVFAALGRTFLDPDHDELVDVWLVVGGALAVVVTVLLLVGAAPQGLWAVLFAGAVVAARLLPFTVVDVPDEALLDLDRLAVTAWSARERPRGGRRRRSIVRFDGVTTVVHRGLRLVAAGTFVIAGTVALTGPLLVLGADRDRQGIGSLVMVGLGGAALALVARSFRSALPRVALRLAASSVLVFLGYVVLREFGPTTDWVVFASAAALGLLATVTAVSLGRGWRSVWWARVADIVEGLSIVLVVAAAPLASGFFDVVRGFTA
jgi:hypothetical protein